MRNDGKTLGRRRLAFGQVLPGVAGFGSPSRSGQVLIETTILVFLGAPAIPPGGPCVRGPLFGLLQTCAGSDCPTVNLAAR
jgi:hypothetical protein